jgi:prolyl-tRNA synthetase
MAHSDDDGLILPPKLAPIHVVVVPIFRNEDELGRIAEKVKEITASLKPLGLSVKFDNRDTHKPGFKFAEWELKGVPVRIAIGPRDLDNGTVEVARRDTREKQVIKLEEVSTRIPTLLNEIQDSIFQRALAFRNQHITEVNSYDEFKDVLETKGGFISAHWDGTPETEASIKEETKATIRCIPLIAKSENGTCIYSGKKSAGRVLFARAY